MARRVESVAGRSMATFTDTGGTAWKLVLTVGSVADVKRDTGVNLALTAKDAGWVEAIFGTEGKLAEILWVLCADQAAAVGVTPERFPHRLDGLTLEAAGDALAEAIADFFPRSRIAKALRGNLSRALKTAEDKAIEALAATGSPSPTSAPASPASIPAG